MKIKMKQMKMPMAKKPEDEMRDQMAADEMSEMPEEEEEMESPMQEDQEMGMEKQEQPSKLEAVSDDDLVAEIKKRGLMRQLEKGEDMAVGGDESNPEDMV